MADDFRNKLSKLEAKLNLDSKDGDLKKALSQLDKSLKNKSADYAANVKSLLGSLAKKKKNVKDKDAKKAVEQMEAMAKEDMKKRLTDKDASTKPS